MAQMHPGMEGHEQVDPGHMGQAAPPLDQTYQHDAIPHHQVSDVVPGRSLHACATIYPLQLQGAVVPLSHVHRLLCSTSVAP